MPQIVYGLGNLCSTRGFANKPEMLAFAGHPDMARPAVRFARLHRKGVGLPHSVGKCFEQPLKAAPPHSVKLPLIYKPMVIPACRHLWILEPPSIYYF